MARRDTRPAPSPIQLPARITQALLRSRGQPGGDSGELQPAGAAAELGRQPRLRRNLGADGKRAGGGQGDQLCPKRLQLYVGLERGVLCTKIQL